MISPEQYADLAARLAEAGGDRAREHAIAAEHGLDDDAWDAARAHYAARTSDPADAGSPDRPPRHARRTEPCPLDAYARIHAEMAFRKGPDGGKISYHQVLDEHGYSARAWRECEGYWTPRLAGSTDPNFDPEAADRFHALVQEAADRLGAPAP